MIIGLQEMSALNEKVKNCYHDLDALLRQLQNFEKRYQMPSQEFFKKFASGSLPHKSDFLEWYAYLDRSKKLVGKIRELERELGDVVEQKLLAPA
ncbi:MAG: hypothetical protein ONB44_19380 [candidate division KSB1 bacterium]|nr:hypothetical protein [candidate division KSB1 bacterium]MDZ7304292.1 hypothetical protein [candidate division KSB1 bacterium]MDZ7312910.1 hypothetical protein [candidate division KSB1 bacterium]